MNRPFEPEPLFVLETRPSLEMRRRLEQILAGIRAEKRGTPRASQALDELDPLGSRQLLEELVEGDRDLFITHEAKTVLRHKRQKQGR